MSAALRLADIDPPEGIEREKGRVGWDLGLADFDKDRKHRYFLGRYWDSVKSTLLWLMINPSVAGGWEDDHTVVKVSEFSKRFGFGGFEIVNFFSLISSDPKNLRSLPSFESTAMEQHYWTQAAKIYLRTPAEAFDGVPIYVMAGWGATKFAAVRRDEVLKVFEKNTLHCLGKTKGGQPNHPLMLAYATQCSVWRPGVGSLEAAIATGATG